MTYSFLPDAPRKRKRGSNAWVAPEHYRIAAFMGRNEDGELNFDPRPNIMVPERPKIYLSLMEPSAPPPDWPVSA